MAKEITTTDPFLLKIEQLEDAGMEKTRRWTSMWKESLRYFFSEQLQGYKKRENWDWVVLNYIWPSAMQEIAKLTKNETKIICNPWEDSDVDVAEVWQSMLQWLWKNGINGEGMRIEHVLALLDQKIYGYCVSKIFWEDKNEWDEEKQEWIGDVRYRLWNPVNFWADDDEKINDGNCGTFRYVSLEWAQRRWPQFKEELAAASIPFKQTQYDADVDIKGSSASILTSGTGGSDKGTGNAIENRLLSIILRSDNMSSQTVEPEAQVVKISEIYFKDYEEREQKQEEDVPAQERLSTGEIYQSNGIFYNTKTNQIEQPETWPKAVVKKWKKPVFPRGRFIIKAGSTILNPKEEDQVWQFTKWPFIVCPHYMLPHMWQGVDGIQMYKNTQDMINVSVSHLFNNLKMFGDPKIAVETGAIEVPKGKDGAHFKILAGAGSIIRLVRGALNRNAFKIIDPPPISAGALQLYGLFSQEYKNIQGMQSIATGQKMPGKITATEAQWLATSSVDRIALQTLFVDTWIKNCCKMIAEYCQKNYDTGRFIRIVGDDKTISAAAITDKMKTFRYDIDVVPGMTLPYDEDKRLEKLMSAYQLMANPTPNPMLPVMLRELGVPNWKKLMMQSEIQMQFMQFSQLYEAVKAGQVTPEQAVQILVQKATELYAQESQNGMQGNSQEANQTQTQANAV